MDPAFLALSRLRRRKFDASIQVADDALAQNPYDLALWWTKCRALTNKNWIDDTEVDEEGIADLLLDDNAVQKEARPGTSFNRPGTRTGTASSMGLRPMTSNGRPVSGFARPGSARPMTGSLEAAFQGNRPGTSRPVTSSGRFVRLGTASMKSEPGGAFVDLEKMDFRKYIQRPPLARVLSDYIIYVDHNLRKSHELCDLASRSNSRNSWFWEARLGKTCFHLGLMREAQEHFSRSLKNQNMVTTVLELVKVFHKLDQPNSALTVYEDAIESGMFDGDVALMLGKARVKDALGQTDAAEAEYKKVLAADASSVEAISCMAAHQFYSDQPEVALRYYRRLLQMGVTSAECWVNVGLCCFYASQYDMTLNCINRALELADDTNNADIWFNISHIAVGIGDMGLAYQALKVAVSIDNNHAEAFNNLAVLELKKNNSEQARANYLQAQKLAPHNFEAFFNLGLLCFKLGEFEESFKNCEKSLQLYPDHSDSKELMTLLQKRLAQL